MLAPRARACTALTCLCGSGRREGKAEAGLSECLVVAGREEEYTVLWPGAREVPTPSAVFSASLSLCSFLWGRGPCSVCRTLACRLWVSLWGYAGLEVAAL